jgi:hypothetical protein
MLMKNFEDAIGNRNRDFPTCSAVPQQTALPRVPQNHDRKYYYFY